MAQSFSVLFFLIVLAAATAFTRNSFTRTSTKLQAKSKAIPFIDAPAGLDGTRVGDFGFDPLGFTEQIQNMNYVAAAELKHGRVAMIACAGFVFQQYVHLLVNEANPLKAVTTLGLGPNLQILSFIGVIELMTWDKTYKGGAPGALGFDPLNLAKGKTDAQKNDMQLKEIKNGRLAMIGIMGLLAQNIATQGASTF